MAPLKAWGGRSHIQKVSECTILCKTPPTGLVNVIMVVAKSGRARKGKNFSQDEERQLCKSVLHVSQDPVTGNGQWATAFWERIINHYQENRPGGCVERPMMSLEMKWGVIKHDVNKFYGVYKSVSSLRESSISNEDILDRALELYKVRHPGQQPFFFLHCWRLLREVPRWHDLVSMTGGQPVRSPTAVPKRKTPPASASLASNGAAGNMDGHTAPNSLQVEDVGNQSFSKRLSCPQGCKSAKKDLRLQQAKDVAIRAQARATTDLAAANMRKAQVLQDQAALSLFTMLSDQGLSKEAREYLEL